MDFQPELTQNAIFDGLLELPAIHNEKEVKIPDYVVPYSKIKYCNRENMFYCFYEADKYFSDVLSNPENCKILERLRKMHWDYYARLFGLYKCTALRTNA